ncbi:protein IQ-DOMAIN 14-like [Punica granatum]|uniref:DUF4005 domain-containing protein n=2 Tax=Punica granatum TaxID=22663 RepID=A0A218XIH0_PUNGR|nr:protein IQ-DOMAIN 14-like [Punica granatum]OWM84479.1 hypothetical protein CDL15_Pgr000919 [Punica granatum]PKI66111.1 hypothetical protein CRG98_013519 [Punica granatum]
MGRATRWLKGLFGMTKSSKDTRNSNCQHDSKRRNIGVPSRDNDPQTAPPTDISAGEAAWLRAYHSETEKEQSKQAIAVAAATAAAADAAMAAAMAAVAVVKLTGQSRGVMDAVSRVGSNERSLAAIKIQTNFRGYLARKALRALKGLVKLQALVRGYLVRKQANATLQSVQALMRAQATIQSRRSRRPLPENTTSYQSRSQKSMGKFDEMRHEFVGPTHSRRLSASLDVRTLKTVHERLKIVEVDSARQVARSRRANMSEFCFPSFSSPLSSSQIQFVPPTPEYSQNFQEFDGGFTFDECRCSSAQTTPRFSDSISSNNYFLRKPLDKRYLPGYMASTQSYKAKLRSLSAPRKRPQLGDMNGRLSLHDMMEVSRSSLSGVGMQGSCTRAREAINIEKSMIGKLESYK